MRRRLVDLGLTAVGAAALIGLVKALPLLAAFITLPTTWTAGQILTSGDLNAEFASILSQVNGNLDDTNIVASAAIKGSKLADAPNGVTTTKLNDSVVTTAKVGDLQVTSGKLAIGAALRGFQSANPVMNLSVIQASGEQVWVQMPALTTRGGAVLGFPMVQGQFEQACGGLGSVMVKLYRDVTLLQQLNYSFTTPTGTACVGNTEYPVPAPSAFDTPVAGAHVYKVSVTVTGIGTFKSDAVNTGTYVVGELS